MDDKLMESLINSDELITKTIEENNNSFKDLFDQFSSIMSMTIVNGEQIEKQLTEQGEKEAEQIKGALTGNINQASNLTLEKVAESEIQENQGSILSDETVNDLINVIANIQDVLGKINTDQIATITATPPESANANTGINKELIISSENQVGPEAPTPQVNPELTLAQVGPSLPLPQVGPEAPTPQVNPELTLAQVGPSLPLPQVGPEAPTPATNTLNIENLGQVIDDFKTLSNLNWCTDWLKCLEKIIEQADIVKEALNSIPFEKKISLGLNDEELGKLDESIQKVKENISSDINLSTAKNELIEQTVSSNNTPDLSTSFLDSFFELSEKLGLFTDKVENNSISQESFINKVSEFSETTSKTIENTFTTFNDTTKTILEKPNTLETALETIESKVQTEVKPEFLSEFSFEELLNFTIPKFTEVNAQEFLPPPPPPLIPFGEMGMIPSLIKSLSPEIGTVQNTTAPAINLPNEELINIEGVQPEKTNVQEKPTTLTPPPPPPLEFGFESIFETLGFSFPGILPEAEGAQVVKTESPTASLSPLPMGPELQQAETANVGFPKTPNIPAPPPPLEFGFESIFESLGFLSPGILPEAEGAQVVNTESPTASLSPLLPMGPELQQAEIANVGSPKTPNVPAPPPPLEFGFESIFETLGFSFPGIFPEAEGAQVVNTESPTASLSPMPMGPELQQVETANVGSPKVSNVPAPPPPLEFGFESILESLGFSSPGILPTESPTASLSPMPMGPELQQVETANVGSPKVSNVPAPPPPLEFGFESILETLGFSFPGILPEAEGVQVVNTESPTASLSPVPMGPEFQQAETANVGSPKTPNVPLAPPPPMNFMDFLFPKSPVVEEPLGAQVNTVEKNPLNLENLFNFEPNVLSDNTIKETGFSQNEIQKPLGFEELGSLDLTNNSKTTENMGNQFSAKPLPFAPDFNLMSSFPEIETFGEMTLENVQNITEPIYNPLESLFQTKGNEFSKNNVAVGNTKASPPAISNNIEEMLIKNQEVPQVNLSNVATKIQNEIPQSTSELAASTEVMMNEVNLEPLGSQLSSSIDSLSQNMNTQPADAQAATGATSTESSPDVMNQILTMLTNLNSTIKGMSSPQGAGTTVIPQSGGSSLSEAQARIIGRQIANELKDNFSKLYN
jgi:hypothetical protein